MTIYYARDLRRRTLTKMLTFKIATVLNSLVWSSIFGLSFWQALPAALCMNITGLFIYYIKERFWNRIQWGRK